MMLAQDAAAKTLPSKSLLDYIHDGGTVSYVLVLVSFVAVTLVIRNMLIFRKSKQAPDEVFYRLSELLKKGDTEGAAALCAAPENASFLTRVFGSALQRCARSPFGFLELRSALEESGQREADRLHRYNDSIGIIAAVGPMLGLLGTVIGMIGAFRSIGQLEGASRSSELASFMSIALVCTAEGLIIAIPCTVIFSLFRRHVDHLISEIAERIEELTRNLEAMSGGEEKPSPAPTRPRPVQPAPREVPAR
jgi:biopolymer transport protein ExbB